MKALAVITMTFLPSTAVAVSLDFNFCSAHRALQDTYLKACKAILSMPIFDWEKFHYSAYVRRSIWIFCLLSAILTSAVLYLWRFWYLRDVWHREVNNRHQEEKGSTDSASAPLSYPLGDQLLLQGHDKAWVSPIRNKEKI